MGLLSRLNRSGNEVLSPTVVDPGFTVDPEDPAQAVVDWAAAANEPSRSPGRLDDPPPDRSAAALLAQ